MEGTILLITVGIILYSLYLWWCSEPRGQIKPFSSMPGPSSLPLIGTLHHYFWSNKYSFDRLHWNGLSKYREFGIIVREKIVPGVNIVWLFQPSDIRKMYEAEGKMPSRRSHTALGHFRKTRPDRYNTSGLLPTNGPEWRRIRNALQRPTATASATNTFLPGLSQIGFDCVSYIQQHLHTINGQDFLPHLNKIFMEMTGQVVFDRRLDGLQEPLSPDSVPARLIQAAEDTNSNVLPTDNGLPTWKIFENKQYRAIRESQEYIEKVANQFLREKVENQGKDSSGQDSSEDSSEDHLTLLDRWLASPNLDTKDVMTGIAEFLLAGVHTSSYTTAFLLYHLATNQLAQEELRKEAKEVLGERKIIDRSTLANATFARACLKESLRLNPVSVGVGRILPSDTELGGYFVPKGTVVVTQNQVICRFDQYFPQPHSFIPHRWIQGSQFYQEVDPYLTLPFGHGPRACIGKNLAESSILVFMLIIVNSFHIGLMEEEKEETEKEKEKEEEKRKWEMNDQLDCVSLLINKPDRELKLRFTPI